MDNPFKGLRALIGGLLIVLVILVVIAFVVGAKCN